MERNSSFGTSWADQWDYSNHGGSPTAAAGKNKKGDGGGSRWKNGAEKTKAVASSGFKKVKEGTTSGFNWIKNKYQQRRTPTAAGENKKGGGGGRWKSGAEKTKAVASSGFEKAKEGTASGFNWIKNKYQQRRTPKH